MATLSAPSSSTSSAATVIGASPSASLLHQQAVISGKNNEDCGIREVWSSNLDDEFRTIRQLIKRFNFVAMDTEFPGVVARPIGEFKSSTDYQYHLLRCNVDLLRLIQVGLTFMDEKGETPKDYSTWQFNFKFSLGEDMFAQDSIELLTNSGIQFQRHEEDGIEILRFAELLMTSGLVLMDDVKWLSFHSGYDFGYLVKLLTNTTLPSEEHEFFEMLHIYFPYIYDVKYLMKSCKNLKGGLQEVADMLRIDRVGPQHQAGSDSLLTGITFFKMRDVRDFTIATFCNQVPAARCSKDLFFDGNIDDKKYCGHLYGLGAPYLSSNGNAGNFSFEQAQPVLAGSSGGIISEGNVCNPSASFLEQSSSVVNSTKERGTHLHSRSGSASVSSSSVNSRVELLTASGGGDGNGGANATNDDTASTAAPNAASTKDDDADSSTSSGRTSSAPSGPSIPESSGSDSSSETSSNAGGGNGNTAALDESCASMDT